MNTKLLERRDGIRRNRSGRLATVVASARLSTARRLAALVSLGALLSCMLMATGCGGTSSQASPPPQGPQLSLGQSSVSFPDTNVGSTSTESVVVTLSNIGNAMLAISNITDSDMTDFPGSTTCPNPGNVAPGSNCTITVNFTPQSAGALTAQVVVSSNAGTGTISLSGNGVAASECQINTDGNTATFTGTSEQAVVELQNAGQSPVTILDESISGDFQIVAGQGDPWPDCAAPPFTLNANQTCAFNVAFVPTGSGTFTGSLNVATSCPTQQLITYSFTGSN